MLIKMMRDKGVTSDMMFTAGAASIGLSIVTWMASKGAEHTARADRWGIFVGQWAPTFFALGTALKIDEKR